MPNLRRPLLPALCACALLVAACGDPTAPDLWEEGAWTPLGEGIGNNAIALVEHEGSLFAGGSFLTAGDQPARRIARWDGARWHTLDTGMDGNVWALASFRGDLVALGTFGEAGGVTANRVARWDGSQWHAMDRNLVQMCCDPTFAVRGDDLFMTGRFPFTEADTIYGTLGVARWDGSRWDPIYIEIDGWDYPAVAPIVVHEGDLIASARGAGRLARWDGTRWSWMDAPPGIGIRLISGGGELYATGRVDDGWAVSRWTGTEWESLGHLSGWLGAAHFHDGSLVVGGRLEGQESGAVLRLTGNGWKAIDEGMDDDVLALGTFGRSLVAAGSFTTAGGRPARGIAALRAD
jgi:hypothetical protein